ncbi:hypothetical protein H2203_001325 [Taxawa tesnikishii (nom. ined.)]|nr:hypothetical protein H2203_001325 [Dothideales sp. JES 119]
MRTSALLVAPFAATAALAQSSSANVTVVSALSTSISTPPYSNPFTSFLTQTNSLGVVTGQPAAATNVGTNPAAVTTQPAVATIPAGLPAGVTVLNYGNETSRDFTVSVGSSTTVVLGGGVQTIVTSGSPASATTSGASSGSSSGSSGSSGSASGSSSGSRTSGSASSGSSTASASSSAASSSGNAAAAVKVASGALVGAGAFFAAFM